MFDNTTKSIIDKSYYENGTLCLELPYTNGIINGTVKQYYDNGNIHNVIPFAFGYPHGLARSYHKDGLVYKQVLWYRGKIKSQEMLSSIQLP